ncbi:uncharacterized protein LOC106068181 [Biomphalaria glabrata]|uniref:Uncharacterized protein LOC106068181 n=1 Tax=Biomphalaria glabrata TaxID=6526 RepID=A0A9W2YIW8_BIOGL|nr:uncharacterized protein LOC106068181 [Biomphalaria glabrata]
MDKVNTTSEVAATSDFFETWISDEVLWVITVVNYVILSGTISFLGVIFNIVNVVIFAKLGFSDTTNISFLSLSLADGGVVLMLVGYSILYNPLVVEAVSILEVIESVSYIVFGWPYACFSRVAGCMTAFITVERFLCVSAPLKVKAIITRSRTITMAVTCFFVLFASIIPAFISSSLGMKFDPIYNQTHVGLMFTNNAASLQEISLTFNVVVQLGVFCIVVVFTVALIRSFVRKTEWRSTATKQSTKSNARDNKMVKMVILISVVFIILSIPGVVATFLMMFIPEYNIAGRYRNIYIASFSTFFPIGAINSTVNFFIFLDMSTKYRQMFLTMFNLKSCKPKEKKKVQRQIYKDSPKNSKQEKINNFTI